MYKIDNIYIFVNIVNISLIFVFCYCLFGVVNFGIELVFVFKCNFFNVIYLEFKVCI